MEIPFASHKHASIAKQVIEVDAELSPQAVKRELSVHNNILIAYAQHSFFENTFCFFLLILICLDLHHIGHFIR